MYKAAFQGLPNKLNYISTDSTKINRNPFQRILYYITIKVSTCVHAGTCSCCNAVLRGVPGLPQSTVEGTE